VPDDVYLQEVGAQVASGVPLTSVAVLGGRVFAGSGQGLLELRDGALAEVAEMRSPVQRLVVAEGALWVLGPDGLRRGDGRAWRRLMEQPVVDATEFRGRLVVASGNRLWQVEGDTVKPLGDAEAPFGILRLAVHHETLMVLGRGQLVTYAEGEFGSPEWWSGKPERAWDWGEFPSLNTRDMLSSGNRLYVATDRGLGVIRGMNLTAVRGDQGLCYEDAVCLAPGFTNDVWVGTTRGAIRMVDGRFHYFAGRRWLPDDDVRGVATGGRTVYVATAAGLGILRYEPFTLLKKAAYYEQHLARWGHKRLGFVHKLEWDDAQKAFVREISDNDGGYTEDYLVAQTYRFAVTGDPAARAEATNTFHAMRWLEGISGIPGFPARAVWAKGETGHKSMFGSGNYPAEWHDAADGRFEWKGDTSSDEISAHFYGLPVFLALAAQGDEVGQAKALLGRMAGHLVDHGWRLVDLDGKPTRWGRWDPDYYTSGLEGMHARGLNALELLSFVKAGEELTGDPRFREAYQALVQLGYPNYTLRASATFPSDAIAHFDDQLGLFVYGNLMQLEKDPDLHATFRRSLERSWETVRIEQNPWYNFVYGMLTGSPCEPEAAVAHLREWPLDLKVYSYQNSHRSDYRTPPGYTPLKGGVRAFSPRETQPMRWDRWTLEPDGGNEGRDVEHPAAWLAAYWLGRYAGFIAAPTATDPAVLEVRPGDVPGQGARPYDGPARTAGY
jgi:hypothetical protein